MAHGTSASAGGWAGIAPRDITRTGASVALLALSAWVTVPLGPVPLTLQTMALAFVALALTPSQAIGSVALYVALGSLGLPLFSGMRGGLGVIAGPTGGFISGFLVGMVAAQAVLRAGRDRWHRLAACAALLGVSYALGCLQLMAVASLGPGEALLAGCLPFVIPDIVKALVGSRVARSVCHALPGLFDQERG